MEIQAIRLGRNDRGVLIGQTGSGKSVLADKLLNDPWKRKVIVFDPKGSDTIAKWTTPFHRYTSLDEVIEAAEDRGEERIIFTPHPFYAEDPDLQIKLFDWIYTRGFTRLYIDEATSISSEKEVVRMLTACLNRGRERGVSTLTATQRPARISLNMLSEAQCYYIFQLLQHSDKKRVEEITGIPIEQLSTLRPFEYFYWNARTGAYPSKLILRLGVRTHAGARASSYSV